MIGYYSFQKKEEENSDIHYSMDKPQRHYAKRNESDTKEQILYNYRKAQGSQSESQTQEVKGWFPRLRGFEKEELLFNEHGLPGWEDENILDVDGGEGGAM